MMVSLYDVILLFSSAVAFWRAHTGGNLRAPTQGDGVRGRVRAERRVAGHRGRVLERGSHPLQPQDARRVPIRRSSHRKKPTKQIIKQTTETVKNLFLPPARPFSPPPPTLRARPPVRRGVGARGGFGGGAGPGRAR
jgi:hypothetical protein